MLLELISFFLYPFIVGVIISIIAAPLGTIMLWKRITYFGDSLSHAALFGIAISLLFEVSEVIGIISSSIAFSLYLMLIRRMSSLNLDVIISFITSFFLALAIIVMNISGNKQDLATYLFGDILLSNSKDVIILSTMLISTFTWFAIRWKQILKIIINEEIAIVEKINVNKITLEYVILLSLIIAGTVKIVGALLITSMLIIPAVIAARISSSPKMMVSLSLLTGIIIFSIGYIAGIYSNQPISPAVIISGSIMFLIIYFGVPTLTLLRKKFLFARIK